MEQSRLEKKIDQLIQDFSELKASVSVANARWSDRLPQCQRHEEAIFGNGKEGLCTQVKQLETWKQEQKDKGWRLAYWIIGIATAISTVLGGIVSPLIAKVIGSNGPNP